jgi:polyribonucleotide nucleotidyltransferase
VEGPPTRFGTGKIACLTESSVVGTSGQTVLLATMATDSRDASNQPVSVRSCLRLLCQESFTPLTVDYRQRHHAVGRIPTNSASRTDNQRPSTLETLASRAIDRALRPLIMNTKESIQISCSVQACPLHEEGKGGHPVALGLNAASVAMQDRLREPVACVYLCLLPDGTCVVNPSASPSASQGELLYAGTRDKVVMMEFNGMLPEEQLMQMVQLAHSSIQPILDIQQEMIQMKARQQSDDVLVDDDFLHASLGLTRVCATEGKTDKSEEDGMHHEAVHIYNEAMEWCKTRLQDAPLRLFGFTGEEAKSMDPGRVSIHPTGGRPLISKSVRGRREHLVRKEIQRLLMEFESDKTYFRALVEEDPNLISELSDTIHSKLLRESLQQTATKYKCRADGRGSSTNGCTTIRPLSMTVPSLPDCVHGSALFTRGETQVLCTATLGAPKDGILLNDPYLHKKKASVADETDPLPFHDLPVGSLRYLKTQEHLESDLNTRKVRADREQTGDIFQTERRRAFLQYDFPAYSKGEVQVGSFAGTQRREIGHGALAEKAILPILPPASEFPYAIRITSEVTSSNGSSSMASVCGATLALLDAGVPIKVSEVTTIFEREKDIVV